MRQSLLVVLTASLLAGSASAAPVDFTGTLSIEIGGVGSISEVAVGTAEFTDPRNFQIPAGALSIAKTVNVELQNMGTVFVSLAANVSNGPGTFTNGGGPMPLNGSVQICMFATGCGSALTVPLSADATNAVGVGGEITAAGPMASVTVAQLGPWTTGTASITNPFGGHFPATITSLGGVSGNTVTLVTPLAIFTSLSGGPPFLPAFATLELTFVPEPGTLLLLGAGVAGLGLVRRCRA